MDESPPLSRSSSITAIALEEATSEEDGGEAEGPSPPHPSASSSVQLLQPSSSGKSLRSVSESLAADSSSMAGAASEGPVSEEPHKVITVGREGQPKPLPTSPPDDSPSPFLCCPFLLSSASSRVLPPSLIPLPVSTSYFHCPLSPPLRSFLCLPPLSIRWPPLHFPQRPSLHSSVAQARQSPFSSSPFLDVLPLPLIFPS